VLVVAPPELPAVVVAVLPEEMMGDDRAITPAAKLVVVPVWMPTLVLAEPPPQLLSVVPVRTVAALPEPTPIIVPAEAPPRLYVAPYLQGKQDRH